MKLPKTEEELDLYLLLQRIGFAEERLRYDPAQRKDEYNRSVYETLKKQYLQKVNEYREPLKLFVWEDVLHDHKSGIAFAYAPDAKTARELVWNSLGHNQDDLLREPDEITKEAGFHCYG